MVSEFVFDTIRRVGSHLLLGILGLSLTVVAGCADSQRQENTFGVPDLPFSDSFGELPRDGRREASLQLTAEGYTLLRSGNLDESISRFQKAISLSPTNPFTYYFFGEARYLKKEYEQSLALLERAEMLLQDDPVWLSRVYVLRGRDFEALAWEEDAAHAYLKALAQDPGNQEAAGGLARLFAAQP